MEEMRSAIAVALPACMLFDYAPFDFGFDIRRCSRSSTDGGTSPEIFPPRPKTSFTSRELMNEYASLAIMNTVSISGPQPPVHQRHLQLVLVVRNGANAAQQHGRRLRAPHGPPAARRTNPPPRSDKRAPLRAAFPSALPREKSGCFASFRRIETISRSNIREPRWIRSRWPLVIGSNDPG